MIPRLDDLTASHIVIDLASVLGYLNLVRDVLLSFDVLHQLCVLLLGLVWADSSIHRTLVLWLWSAVISSSCERIRPLIMWGLNHIWKKLITPVSFWFLGDSVVDI